MANTVEYGIRINVDGDRAASAAFDQVAASTTQLGATVERTGQTLGALNGQMNDTAAIMRKNAEETSAASQAAQQFLAPLQRQIDLFGASRAETERYNAAQAGLSATTQRQAAALGSVIDAMQRDEQEARNFAAEQDRATRAADAFLKKLNEQVGTLGMNAQQLQTYRAAQLGVSDAAAPMISKLAEAGTGANTAGKHMEGLNFQTVGARRELLVLAHELSQGNFQKFGGSMMVLGEQTGAAGLLFSATGLAALGLVATLGGLAYAAIKGGIEQKKMNDALVMTGNYAGLTSDSLNNLAHAAVSAGGSIGEAKKVAIELAGSGKFTGDQIGYITQATVAWEHATGQSVQSIIKDFESLAVQTTGSNMRATEAISRATVKLDDQYHFLTEAVFEQIRALEKEGDAKGASALATETFAKTTHDRADEILANLGSVARAWNGIKEAIGGAVDELGNFGKRATPASDVKKYSSQLQQFDEGLAGSNERLGRKPDEIGAGQAAARLQIVLALTDAVDKLNKVDAVAVAQGRAKVAESEAVHAASRIAADDAKMQKKNLGELQVALSQYADDVAKIKAVNPGSELVTDDAIAQHIAAVTKAHQANVKGNDDRAKTLQDGLVLEQTSLGREKSIYDAREKMLALYHAKFGTSDADFYAGREAARAEYVASEAIAFAKESALIQGYKPKNAEEIAANKTKYDQLLKQHLEFVDGMRNAGGDDSATAAAAAKKSYDDIVKATHDAGVAEIKRLDDAIIKQREHNAEIGKSKDQVDQIKQAAVDLDTVQMQSDADFIRGALEKAGFDDKAAAVYAIRLNDLDEEIKRRKELAGLLGSAAILDADAKSAAEASKAWKHTATAIETDLTNAILDGGGKGWKKLVRDMEFAFARMVLQPTLQSVAGGIASMVNPAAAQAQAGVGVAGNAAGSAAGSMVGGLFGAGGLSGSLMAGAGWVTGASTLGGSLAAGASLVGTGTLAGGMAGAGMIVGALAPIALGIAAAVAIWKKLDTSGTYHTGGASSASASGVSTIAAESLHFEATRTNTETEKMTAAIATGIVHILDSTASAFGKTAGYTAATAFADDTSKDGAWGGLVISKLGAKILDWQDSKTGAWAPKVFSDGAAGQAEYLAALGASVRTALDDIGLPEWAKTMLGNVGSGASIEDLAKVVDSINATQHALVIMGEKLNGFAGLSDAATSALIANAGGIDALVASASSYYDNFYSEAEKMSGTAKQVSDALAAVGIAMPATRDAFRAEVEAQLALGEAGAPAVAALLKVEGAFAQLTPVLDLTAAAARKTAGDYVDAYTAAGAAVRSSLASLGDVLSGLSDKAQAAAAGVKSSQNSISQAYFGAQDAVAAAQQKITDLATQSAQAMSAFSGTIRDFLASLNAGQVGAPGLAALKAQFSSTAVLAQGGDKQSQSALVGIAGKLIESLKSNSGNAVDFAIGEASVKATLSRIASGIVAAGPASAADPAGDAQTQLVKAQDRLLEYAALASVTGASTDRSAQITAGSTAALLAAFNAASSANDAARSDYATALSLTSHLAMTSTNSLSGLMSGLKAVSDAQGQFMAARDDLAAYVITTETGSKDLDKFTANLVKSLGLTGAEADKLTALLKAPGTAALTLAEMLGSGAVTVSGSADTLASSLGLTATAFGGVQGVLPGIVAALSGTGAEADKLAALLGPAVLGTAANSAAANLGLVGSAAQSLVALMNAISYTPPAFPVPTTPGSGPGELSAGQEFIAGLYTEVLGRIPDAAGLRYWADKLGAGLITLTSAATDIALSAASHSVDPSTPGYSEATAIADEAGGKAWLRAHNVPGYAAGGDFGGGLRIVGENGPELESTGPSRIWNASQTRSMLSGGDSKISEQLLQELIEEVRELRAEQRTGNAAIVNTTNKGVKIWRAVTQGGIAVATVAGG